LEVGLAHFGLVKNLLKFFKELCGRVLILSFFGSIILSLAALSFGPFAIWCIFALPFILMTPTHVIYTYDYKAGKWSDSRD
jgi:hypothetical protein